VSRRRSTPLSRHTRARRSPVNLPPAHDRHNDVSSSLVPGGAEEETAAPAAAAAPPPARRAPAAKLAFDGEAAAYAGSADEAPSSGAAKAAPGRPLLGAGGISGPGKVPAGGALSVAFQTTLGGEPAAPQQAVLRLSPLAGAQDGGPSAYVWARRRKGGSDGDLIATVTHAEVERQVGRVPAALAATLLVGDPAAAAAAGGSGGGAGVEWALGEVRFAEAAAAAPATGKQAKLLTASHQPLHNALPDIRHTFRRPERRAPAAVSLAFTGLALAPLALLVPALVAAGANMKGWPSDPAAAAWAVAFLGSLAATLLLLVVFWLRLTLATLLWPATGMGFALWFSGWKALKAHASARLAEEQAAGKKDL